MDVAREKQLENESCPATRHKIRLGASLVQLLTTLIFRDLRGTHDHKGRAQLLARDGVKNVADAVGVDAV